MNKQRRKSLEEQHLLLTQLRADLDSIDTEVAGHADDEQEAFDNYSEGLQASDQGQRTEQAAEFLATAKDELTSALNSIDEALAAIDEAVGL